MLKRTPLFAAHQKLGARIVEFGGWEMPVQYSSIVDEHLCVRRAAGIFDICHMGEVLVSGPDAAAFLNATLTNDIAKLVVGLGQYTLMCNEQGGVVDDLYAYRIGESEFLLIINASRIGPDVAWLRSRLAAFPKRDGVKLEDVSDTMGAVAVQGPRVVEFIAQVFGGASHGGTTVAAVTELKKNQIGKWTFDGQPVWVGRTGYTGEDGFEVIAPAAVIEAVWNRALALGHVGCLQPCGLGARDTLRTEVCYPLYGHELDEHTTPIEAGLGFFVAVEKGDFTGRAVLAEQKAKGVTKRSVAFRMTDKSAPPRPHYAIFAGGAKIGEVVSGTQSPSLNVGIGIGYVPPKFAEPGTKLEIEIRGKLFPAEVVKKPIYKKA
ncbi:MAG: glycine cleavage system aminomethyltransferase GcvT [Verrucomicrobia bacterium]|nr:glycine cleavage system aminomethyltransferase GcvT [Verrucomicrobiota bacterium]